MWNLISIGQSPHTHRHRDIHFSSGSILNMHIYMHIKYPQFVHVCVRITSQAPQTNQTNTIQIHITLSHIIVISTCLTAIIYYGISYRSGQRDWCQQQITTTTIKKLESSVTRALRCLRYWISFMQFWCFWSFSEFSEQTKVTHIWPENFPCTANNSIEPRERCF